MEFISSEKGNPKFLFNGFLFVKDKQIDTKIYWKCEYFHSKKCKSRVITERNEIKKEPVEHNHGGDAARLEVTKFLDQVRDSAKNTLDTPHRIISTHSAQVSTHSIGRLPEIHNIKRTIRNIRQRNDGAPALPQSRRDIIFPDVYKQTLNKEVFLQFDSGATDSRILVFGTQKSLKLLEQSNHWFMDGTFKTVPHLFGQLYTIHGLKDNYSIPLLYALLPSKAQSTYTTFLQEVKNLLPTAAPSTVMIDFEQAMINAVSIAFPEARIRGCFFHFCQCVYRKIQSSGLKQRYDNDAEFSLKIRMLNALAFVPVQFVERAFNELDDAGLIPEEVQPVVDYFEDTWIGRPDRRNRRRAPTFPHRMWNCFDGAIAGLPKTNNAVEGWHRSFESQISASHPSIWKFVDAIKREHSLNELKIEQYTAGAPPPTPRKKYSDCAKRILNIIDNFDPTNILDYLKGIAHNLSY